MKCQNIIVNDLYRPGRKVLLCEDCQISKKSYIMRETRKRKRESDPTSPSSRARFNYLSPTSKNQRYQKIMTQSRKAQIYHEQAKKRLESLQFDMKLNAEKADEDSVEAVLLKALSTLTTNTAQMDLFKEKLTMHIASDWIKDRRDKADEVEQEVGEFVSTILEQICSYRKVLEGKEKTLRYSAPILNLALTIYLRSQKSYDEVRNSSFLVPSANT